MDQTQGGSLVVLSGNDDQPQRTDSSPSSSSKKANKKSLSSLNSLLSPQSINNDEENGRSYKSKKRRKEKGIRINDDSSDDTNSVSTGFDDGDSDDDNENEESDKSKSNPYNDAINALTNPRKRSYLNKSFASMLSYVLAYCKNCLQPEHLAALAVVCELPESAMEVVLRLGSRKGPLFDEGELVEKYSGVVPRVQTGVDTLVEMGVVVRFRCCDVVDAAEGAATTASNNWIETHADVLPKCLVFSSSQSSSSASSSPHQSSLIIECMLRSLKVSQLKDVFFYMAAAVNVGTEQQPNEDGSKTEVKTTTKKTKKKAPAAAEESLRIKRPFHAHTLPPTVPSTANKHWLLHSLLRVVGLGARSNSNNNAKRSAAHASAQEEEEEVRRRFVRSYRIAFGQAWDALLGSVVCLNRHVIDVLETIFLLFSVVVPGAPMVAASLAATGGGVAAASRGFQPAIPPLPSNSATLSSLQVLAFPPTVLSRFVLPVLHQEQKEEQQEEEQQQQEDDDDQIQHYDSFANMFSRSFQPKVPFILFRNNEEWKLYQAAMKLENELFNLVENRGFMTLANTSRNSSRNKHKQKQKQKQKQTQKQKNGGEVPSPQQQQQQQQQERGRSDGQNQREDDDDDDGEDKTTKLLERLLCEISDGIGLSRAELNKHSPWSAPTTTNNNSSSKHKKENDTPFLYDVLYRRSPSSSSSTSAFASLHDDQVAHLLKLTPLHKWLTCASGFVELLEYSKLYGEAIKWLDVLLCSAVCPDDSRAINRKIPLHERCEQQHLKHHSVAEASNIALYSATQKAHPEFAFRINKRGYWFERKILDLTHLKRGDEALNLAEQVLRENNATPGHPLCFLRRGHRVAIENTLVRLHRPPRRWTGPPTWLLTKALLDGRHITVHASKHFKTTSPLLDSQDGLSGDAKALFRPRQPSWEGAHKNDDTSVEGCALAWYVGGRGRREKGWDGRHCEGGWIAGIFTLLFLDVMFPCLENDITERVLADIGYQQDRDTSKSYTAGPDAVGAADVAPYLSAVFTSCYHGAPLDYAYPCFYRNRRAAFDARLDFVHPRGTRSQILDFASRCLKKYRPYSSVVGLSADLPLLKILAVIPLAPLRKLLKKLVCGYDEGILLRFSGFPDLVLWRELPPQNEKTGHTEEERKAKKEEADGSDRIEKEDSVQSLECLVANEATTPATPTASPSSLSSPTTTAITTAPVSFILSEVKSPSDRLSEKQIALIDTLIRCGFTTEVCHVQERFEAVAEVNDNDRSILTHSGQRRKGINEKAAKGSGFNPHEIE